MGRKRKKIGGFLFNEPDYDQMHNECLLVSEVWLTEQNPFTITSDPPTDVKHTMDMGVTRESHMTTTISITAHCADKLHVVVETYDSNSMTQTQYLRNGQHTTVHATDTREIRVREELIDKPARANVDVTGTHSTSVLPKGDPQGGDATHGQDQTVTEALHGVQPGGPDKAPEHPHPDDAKAKAPGAPAPGPDKAPDDAKAKAKADQQRANEQAHEKSKGSASRK